MVIILISGSVGSGKTTIAKELSKKLNYKLIHLNEIAKKFKINSVEELQTFDFDLDQLLYYFEKEIQNFIKDKKNVIIESHFSHFINPELVDYLIILNRDLRDLKKEYMKRGYNKKKIEDNLEVESFNLCFYEAIENGFGEEINSKDLIMDSINLNNQIKKNKSKIYSIENSNEIQIIIDKIIKDLKLSN